MAELLKKTNPLGELLNPIGNVVQPQMNALQSSQAFKGVPREQSQSVAKTAPVTLPKLGFGGVSTVQQFYPETGTTISPEVMKKAKEIAPTFRQEQQVQEYKATQPIQQEPIVPQAQAAEATDEDILNSPFSTEEQSLAKKMVDAGFDDTEIVANIRKYRNGEIDSEGNYVEQAKTIEETTPKEEVKESTFKEILPYAPTFKADVGPTDSPNLQIAENVLKTVGNVPSSAYNTLAGIVNVVASATTSPIDTTKAIVDGIVSMVNESKESVQKEYEKNEPALATLNIINKALEKGIKIGVESPVETITAIKPTVGIKGAKEVVTRPVGAVGTGIKKTGESLYKTAVKPTAQEAEKILEYRAGIGSKPVTVAETALKKGVAGTETRIGVQGLKKANEIFKRDVEPVMSKSTTEHSLDDIFTKAAERIDKSKEGVLRKADLKEGLEALKEEYKTLGVDKLSTKALNTEKSSLDRFTPEKVFKGKPIANAYNDAKNYVANVMRDEVHKDLGQFGLKSQEAFRDYANLMELKKVGVKGLTEGGLKGGFGGFWTTMYDQIATPIKTVGGQVLYRVGDKLEFLGPKGINKVGDFLKGKFSIDKKGILTPNFTEDAGIRTIDSVTKDISGNAKPIVKKPIISLSEEKIKAGIKKKSNKISIKEEQIKAGIRSK